MNTFYRSVLSLLTFALSAPSDTARPPALPPGFFSDPAVLALADAQQLTSLLFHGACRLPAFSSSPLYPAYLSRMGACLRHDRHQRQAYETLATRLDQAGIDYLPLKGLMLKSLYPLPEMRIMGDCDLLIRGRDGRRRARAVMASLGYRPVGSVFHCDEYIRSDGLIVELHRCPFPRREQEMYERFGDEWKYAVHAQDPRHPCRYELRPEEHFLLLLSHFAMHLRGRGAGIKFALDVRVFASAHPDMDEAYLARGLEVLGLRTFYEHLKRTLAVWFDGAPSDPVTERLTERLFDASVYGREEDGPLAEVSRHVRRSKRKGYSDGRALRVAMRTRRRHLFFLPYATMKEKYPLLIRWGILLPLFWLIRGADILLHHRNKLTAEYRTEAELRSDRLEGHRGTLRLLGLEPVPPDASPHRQKRPASHRP